MSSKSRDHKQENLLLFKMFVSIIVLGLVLSSGCTKELPYEKELKEDVISKSLVDQEEEYLYLPSLQNVSRSSEGTLPYWMGQVKRVKFEITKDALLAYEQEIDDRFSQNKANRKLVMSIPIENVEYRCQEDRYGECQNKEEENDEITWDKKSQFKFKADKLEIVEASFLPIELSELFGQNCYEEKSAKLLDYTVTDTDINIRVEKSFDVNIACINSRIESLSDTTATIVYHYSFAKKDSIASKNYEPISYPEHDQSTFGFFATERVEKDVDNSERQEDQQALLHRWNPKKEVLTYYLSPEFKEKENQKLREATEVAVRRVNQGLKEADTGLAIEIKDAPENLHSGSLRASMIVLVEDPSKAGPAGYGPTAVNPETGEILSARVVMFPGLMKQYIKMTYEDLYEAKLDEDKKAASSKEQKPQQSQDASSLAARDSKLKAKKSQSLATARPRNQFVSANLVEEMKAHVEHSGTQTSLTSSNEDRFEVLSKHNIYPVELLNFNSALQKGLGKALGDNLKPWGSLSKSERQKVIDVVLPETWTSTLVHEIGHTLGLRHNFKASVDKENHYTQSELKKMGINHEIPYSSTMDYAFTDLNDLPTLGKYDIAALRFAYKREVAVKEGDSFKLVPIQSSLDELAFNKIGNSTADAVAAHSARGSWLRENLKSYGYCTDEHVSVNADCNRFDEGTTRTEIVQHLITNNYEGYYSIRNNRSGRAHFSLVDDAGYVSRIRSLFTEIRLNFETYESLKSRFNLSDDDAVWDEVEWLKDLKEATMLSGRFFMDVLKTPDLTCVIAKTDNPNQILGLQTLSSISRDAESCAEVQWSPGFMSIGQAGKTFNSFKAADNPSSYLDQIDVRGVAYDKILALEALLKRRIGIHNFDVTVDNYMDIPALNPEIKDTLQSVFLDVAQGQLPVKDNEGNTQVVNAVYQLGGDAVIPEALHPYVTRTLDLPKGEVHFNEQVLHVIKREMTSSSDHFRAGQEVVDHFDATKLFVHDPIQTTNPDGSPIDGLNYYDFGKHRYVAHAQNVLATEAITALKTLDLFEAVGKERATEIVALRQQNQELPADLTTEEQAFAALPIQLATQAVQEQLASADHFLDLLDTMSK